MPEPFPEPGQLFEGRYRVGPLIGSGGFARVYKARQEDLGRDVALKVLTPSEMAEGKDQYADKLADRFIQEARLVSRLRDPHTITMYDYGQTDGGLLYMVFEYINGVSLSALVKREGAIAPERVVKILKQTLSSLEEAHAHDYLHRDIKPGNIMVFEHVGRPDQVKLLDFGIAKVTDNTSTLKGDLTADGALIGTPRYMSPEQIRGQEMNAQSDIYSLGLVAFELVMGRKAIESNSSVTIIGQQLDPIPFEIPDMPGCPAGLRMIINRMLAKDRDARFATAREVLNALENWRAPEGVFGIEHDDATVAPSTDPIDLQETARLEDISSELDDPDTRQIPRKTGPQPAVTADTPPPGVHRPVSEHAPSSSSSQDLTAAPTQQESARPAAFTPVPPRESPGSRPLDADAMASTKPVATNSSRFERDVYKGPKPSATNERKSTVKLAAAGIGLLLIVLLSFGAYHFFQGDGAEDAGSDLALAPAEAPEQAPAEPAEAENDEKAEPTEVATNRRMLIRTTPNREIWVNGRPLGKTPVTIDEASVRFPAKVRVALGPGSDHVVEVPAFEKDVQIDVSSLLQGGDKTEKKAETEEKVAAKPEPKPRPRTKPKPRPRPKPRPKPIEKDEPAEKTETDKKDEKLTLPALDY